MAKIKSLPNLNAARLITVLLWFLIGLCAVYWGLKMGGQATPPNAQQAGFKPPAISKNLNFGGILGANALLPVAQTPVVSSVNASRFVLQGTASNGGGGGTAILSVDGKPARSFRVGQKVVDDIVLKEVNKFKAVVGDATIEMPKLAFAMPGNKTQNPGATTVVTPANGVQPNPARPGSFLPPGGTAFTMPPPLPGVSNVPAPPPPPAMVNPNPSAPPPIGHAAIINNINANQAAMSPEVANLQGSIPGQGPMSPKEMEEEMALSRGGQPPRGFKGVAP